jgi:3-deoxy-manno-octulosonate cytidylyltransferase (CMP-KDO synthetase)
MMAVAIIPARYASSRFPGKPLQLLAGKPLIRHAYENAVESGLFNRIVIATDDDRVAKIVKEFKGEVVITSDNHISGTDRCAEALEKIGGTFDVVVNLQGDEPFMTKDIMQPLLNLFQDKETQIGTLAQKIASIDELLDPGNAKIVMNEKHEALYFSRAAIPSVRGVEQEDWLQHADFWNHVGLYAFRPNVLKQIVKLPPSPLEMIESLEQLRWLENGYKISVNETVHTFIGVDTPEDLEAAEEWYQQKLTPNH